MSESLLCCVLLVSKLRLVTRTHTWWGWNLVVWALHPLCHVSTERCGSIRFGTVRVSTIKKLGRVCIKCAEPHTPCDRGIKTNKHSTREVFLNDKSFFYWRKCCVKVCRPSWTPYIVALCLMCHILFMTFFFICSYWSVGWLVDVTTGYN